MNPGMVNDADAISRFNREAANASRINHANVAAVYDFGETKDGLIYLAMEFVEGPALTKVIEEAGALTPLRAADITRQAAEALAVAHDMGIVHRDLKPDNIMLAKGRDGSDIVKVVDFGIAKAAADETQKVTKTGLVVGTPEYMSPEQLAGDKLDGRSDTYSLALVAFAMLTGKLPFPADTVQESMIARLTDSPKTLSEMRPQIPWSESVQAVMNKALERDAPARYQSAHEFGKELYKAVQAMSPGGRASGATHVIDAVAPAPVSKTAAEPVSKAPATKPIPATRIGTATPHGAPVAPETPAGKSKMPMIAAAAVVVLAVGGFGAWKMMGGKADAGAAPTQQATAPTTPLNQPVQSAPPVADLSPAFEVIDPLVDITQATPETANQALAKLDSITAVAQNDSDKVHILLRKAEAHFILSDAATAAAKKSAEKKLGCDIIKNNEGKAARFANWNKNFQFYIRGSEQIAAQCPIK
jgi:serine/threonine-protein kinase